MPVWKQYILSIKEASIYFGIEEKKLCRLIEKNPNASWFLKNGLHIQIKRKQFGKSLIR